MNWLCMCMCGVAAHGWRGDLLGIEHDSLEVVHLEGHAHEEHSHGERRSDPASAKPRQRRRSREAQARRGQNPSRKQIGEGSEDSDDLGL